MSKAMKFTIGAVLVAILALAFGAGYQLGDRTRRQQSTGITTVGEVWDIVFTDYVDKSKLDSKGLSRAATPGGGAARTLSGEVGVPGQRSQRGGLRGLQPLSAMLSLGLRVVRPLLPVSRQETVGYCRLHRLRPRADASNLSLSPLRNRVRLQLLPQLRSYNPAVAEALLRTARLAADDLAFIDKEVARRRGRVTQKQGNTFTLDKKKFVALPSALKRHLLRASIEELLGNLKDIEARHIESIMEALTKPAGRRLIIPADLVFFIE